MDPTCITFFQTNPGDWLSGHGKPILTAQLMRTVLLHPQGICMLDDVLGRDGSSPKRNESQEVSLAGI